MYMFYSIGDVFQFGKHKGSSLSDVLEEDYTYLYWCVNEIPEFTMSWNVLDEIKQLFPDFIIPYNFFNHIWEEYNEYSDESDGCEEDVYEEKSYEKYSGTWAQEVEGYSDDDIDIIFDGDPSAYWNID